MDKKLLLKQVLGTSMTFRDTVSDDTTQTLKEIEIEGDKWKLENTEFDVPLTTKFTEGSLTGVSYNVEGVFKEDKKYLIKIKTALNTVASIYTCIPKLGASEVMSTASTVFQLDSIGLVFVNLNIIYGQDLDTHIEALNICAFTTNATDITSQLEDMITGISAVEIV